MFSFKEWRLREALKELPNLRITHEFDQERIRGGNYKGRTLPILDLYAYLGDEYAGDLHLVQEPEGWVSYGVNVLPAHQRKGVATALYNYAEKLLGVTLKPSSSQTDDGKAFWANRLKNLHHGPTEI